MTQNEARKQTTVSYFSLLISITFYLSAYKQNNFLFRAAVEKLMHFYVLLYWNPLCKECGFGKKMSNWTNWLCHCTRHKWPVTVRHPVGNWLWDMLFCACCRGAAPRFLREGHRRETLPGWRSNDVQNKTPTGSEKGFTPFSLLLAEFIKGINPPLSLWLGGGLAQIGAEGLGGRFCMARDESPKQSHRNIALLNCLELNRRESETSKSRRSRWKLI